MTQPEAPADVRYKVGDVCRIADVQPYVLRYWESEFSLLARDRAAAGPRMYSGRDLRVIIRIKKLLYDEGYTIAGAKKRLEGELKDGTLDAMTVATTLPEPAAPPEGQAAAEANEGESQSLFAVPSPPPSPSASRARGGRTQPIPAKLDKQESGAVPPPQPVPPPPPAPAAPDRRVARVVAELKEVISLLSRPEP